MLKDGGSVDVDVDVDVDDESLMNGLNSGSTCILIWPRVPVQSGVFQPIACRYLRVNFWASGNLYPKFL